MGRVQGKVVLITGAGSGQGFAAALLFAREGASVVLNDVSAARLQRAVEEARLIHAVCIGIQGDVSSAADVAQMVDGAIRAFGRLDCLYNNAAINIPNAGDGPVGSMQLDAWDRVLRVNLDGVMLTCRAAIPYMMDQGSGSIINVSSAVAVVGGGAHAYSASKGGVIALTRAIAVSYAPKIRANVICPGSVRSGMTDITLADPERRAYWIDNTPLKRMAEPEEIAPLAVYLASDESTFVTGSVFVIDGGFTAR